MMLRGIEDSRGRMRSVFPVAVSWANDPKGAPTPARAGLGRLISIGVPVAVLIVLAVGFTTVSRSPALLAVGVAVAGVLGASLVWMTRSMGSPAPTYDAFTALLANDFCPGCGYGIGDIRPEHDGCTVCPECGAAWRR